MYNLQKTGICRIGLHTGPLVAGHIYSGGVYNYILFIIKMGNQNNQPLNNDFVT